MINADTHIQDSLAEEAAAFDQRITERTRSGFVPDLRRSVKCEYFYKSFWRDPYYIRLYLGIVMHNLLDLVTTHCGRGLRVLDAGCGAGQMSLEFARNGYHVTGIDISESCIRTARKMLAENPFKEGFGSLSYHVMPFDRAEGVYDVILFCGSLHHMEDIRGAARRASEMLRPGGHILCHEPCHERYRRQDAAQVALIRGMLALSDHWYDPQEAGPFLLNEEALETYVNDIHTEYTLERDKDEPGGQSPHDLLADGGEIIDALCSRFTEIETRPGFSFIYRLLGGMRGPENITHSLARFFTVYDRLAVRKGFLRENYFYFLGRKKDNGKVR